MARARHPGQRNSLDALCKRYGVDNSGRELHGALLDSEILADVYLTMTGGQTSLSLAGNASDGKWLRAKVRAIRPARSAACRPTVEPGRIIRASESDLAEHAARPRLLQRSTLVARIVVGAVARREENQTLPISTGFV